MEDNRVEGEDKGKTMEKKRVLQGLKEKIKNE